MIDALDLDITDKDILMALIMGEDVCGIHNIVYCINQEGKLMFKADGYTDWLTTTDIKIYRQMEDDNETT